jgi:ATP-dependent DNA helicase RecQ
VDVLRGNYTRDVTTHGFDKLKTFGAGRDVPARDWQDYLLQMLQLGYFEILYNELHHLRITESGRNVLFGKQRAQLVTINRDKRVEVKHPRKRTAAAPEGGMIGFSDNGEPMFADDKRGTLDFAMADSSKESPKLFEALRALRKQIADQQGFPPYVVFSDKSLHLMATFKPITIEQFGRISGVGEFKCEKYGPEFTRVIRQFTLPKPEK